MCVICGEKNTTNCEIFWFLVFWNTYQQNELKFFKWISYIIIKEATKCTISRRQLIYFLSFSCCIIVARSTCIIFICVGLCIKFYRTTYFIWFYWHCKIHFLLIHLSSQESRMWTIEYDSIYVYILLISSFPSLCSVWMVNVFEIKSYPQLAQVFDFFSLFSASFA